GRNVGDPHLRRLGGGPTVLEPPALATDAGLRVLDRWYDREESGPAVPEDHLVGGGPGLLEQPEDHDGTRAVAAETVVVLPDLHLVHQFARRVEVVSGPRVTGEGHT